MQVWEKESFQERDERAPGILLLTNQFHDLFECLFECLVQTLKGKKMSPARACMTIKYAEQA